MYEELPYPPEQDEYMRNRYNSLTTQEMIDLLAAPGDEPMWTVQLFMIQNAETIPDPSKPYDWDDYGF